jgi:hypothetical protein
MISDDVVPVGPQNDDQGAAAKEVGENPPSVMADTQEPRTLQAEDTAKALEEEAAASEKRGSVMARPPTSFSLPRRRG